ncbi:MAG TPA: hypothetical protein VN793_06500, partial [Acidimicrobiales bacterium]|nr:hypothetical protein [Acidimicrobiales bacterium]
MPVVEVVVPPWAGAAVVVGVAPVLVPPPPLGDVDEVVLFLAVPVPPPDDEPVPVADPFEFPEASEVPVAPAPLLSAFDPGPVPMPEEPVAGCPFPATAGGGAAIDVCSGPATPRPTIPAPATTPAASAWPVVPTSRPKPVATRPSGS